MAKGRAAIGAIIFLCIAPGTIAGLIPWLITYWRPAPPMFGLEALRWIGAGLIVGGLVLLLDCFARFAAQAGTPAPVAPPPKLVLGGLYRFVRNPMYLSVLAIIVGQALLLAAPGLLLYAVVVWAAFHLFVTLYEEPFLEASHRWDYHDYCESVPRWLPRSTAWVPGPPKVRPLIVCASRVCKPRAAERLA